jgi:hypothetical protein
MEKPGGKTWETPKLGNLKYLYYAVNKTTFASRSNRGTDGTVNVLKAYLDARGYHLRVIGMAQPMNMNWDNRLLIIGKRAARTGKGTPTFDPYVFRTLWTETLSTFQRC